MLQLEREALHIPTNNRIKIQVRIIRVYWIAMEPPADPPAHPRILERVLDPRKAKRSLQNLTLVCLQAQIIHHKTQDHLDIRYSAQHVESTAIGVKIVLTTTSVMYARLLHTLHTCAELLNTVITPTRSHVCIYCGKTNHRSVNCRYQPQDNCEEPRTTLDTLRTGTNGKNLASVHPGIKLDLPTLALLIKFLSVSMVDRMDNPTEVNPVHNPEVNRPLIKDFLTGDNNTCTSMNNTTGDTPPYFPISYFQ